MVDAATCPPVGFPTSCHATKLLIHQLSQWHYHIAEMGMGQRISVCACDAGRAAELGENLIELVHLG